MDKEMDKVHRVLTLLAKKMGDAHIMTLIAWRNADGQLDTG